ncbi:hypothetical protein K3712_000540 [Escherichia coli]|nr:hypothetical protein [Escherichia coli]
MVFFPKIKRDKVATYKGNFYVLNENGKWYKMELYLPCGTGTHNEPLDTTANRYLNDIESGKRPFKHAISDNGNINQKDCTRMISKWFETTVY